MSDRKLRRFLHLERARRPDGEPEPAADDDSTVADRFEGVERPRPPAAPAPPRRSGAELGRFGPDPEPVIELADTAGRRPVNRCLRCGMENGLFVTRCGGCSADLDTPEQHAYNERLWQDRQAEDARAEEQHAYRRAAEEQARAEAAQARRAAAESMAREVGQLERRRLDGLDGGWGGGWRGGHDGTPLGLKVLRLLPEAWQVPAAVGAGVLLLGLAGWGLAGGLRGGRGPAVALAVGLAVLLLSPSGWRRRRWW
ncbi:MAG: hypothetical protein QM767_22920 [Anaeromyxobacter sp.]